MLKMAKKMHYTKKTLKVYKGPIFTRIINYKVQLTPKHYFVFFWNRMMM